jgi:hypothetical protein
MPGSIWLFQFGSPRDIELLGAKTTKNQTIRKWMEPAFIEPMQCKPVTSLPAGEKWTFEIKFDGYRCISVKRAGEVTLFSRRQKVLNRRFPGVVDALASVKGDFVLDSWSFWTAKADPHSSYCKALLLHPTFTPSTY